MGRIVAICISKNTGEQKESIGHCELIENHGLKGDAHAGSWHRQVSLLSYEEIEAFKDSDAFIIENGDFGENLIVKDIDLKSLSIGSKLKIGEEAIIRISQRGKECHDRCSIYEQVGDCIMPREGLFAEVIKGAFIKVGDEIKEIVSGVE